MNAEVNPCPVDAENGKSAWPSGSSPDAKPDLHPSCAASLAPEMAQLLSMHQELLVLVRSLVEQNNRMLEALNESTDDDEEDEPRYYLDGSPIR